MLEQQIKDMIKATLPALQAQTLAEELERLYGVETDYKGLVDDYHALEKDIKVLRNKEQHYRYLADDEKKLKEGWANLEKAQVLHSHQVELNAQYATFCNDRVTDHQTMMQIVFKNSVLKRSVLESTTREVEQDPNNMYPNTNYRNDSKTTDTTDEIE